MFSIRTCVSHYSISSFVMIGDQSNNPGSSTRGLVTVKEISLLQLDFDSLYVGGHSDLVFSMDNMS